MPRLTAETPFVHPDCQIVTTDMGRYVEIGQGSRVQASRIGDYSYCDRYADIANAEIGKFANIASYVRIGPTDHPMTGASLHHFLYRSADYWDDVEPDADFFAHRASRRTVIGHDTWLGHASVIRPEVTVGHGAIVGAGAIVTKDVAPYTIVVGNPARVMRRRLPEDLAERMMALAWWDWDHARLRGALEDFRKLGAAAFLDKHRG